MMNYGTSFDSCCSDVNQQAVHSSTILSQGSAYDNADSKELHTVIQQTCGLTALVSFKQHLWHLLAPLYTEVGEQTIMLLSITFDARKLRYRKWNKNNMDSTGFFCFRYLLSESGTCGSHDERNNSVCNTGINNSWEQSSREYLSQLQCLSQFMT